MCIYVNTIESRIALLAARGRNINREKSSQHSSRGAQISLRYANEWSENLSVDSRVRQSQTDLQLTVARRTHRSHIYIYMYNTISPKRFTHTHKHVYMLRRSQVAMIARVVRSWHALKSCAHVYECVCFCGVLYICVLMTIWVRPRHHYYRSAAYKLRPIGAATAELFKVKPKQKAALALRKCATHELAKRSL